MTWEYIAGFFDGEGSIVAKRSGYAVMIPQTNEQVLDQIATFIGVGKVYSLGKRKAHWKDAWVYCVTDYLGTAKVLKGMYPHLVLKKKLASKALGQIRVLLQLAKQRLKLHELREKKGKKLRAEGYTFRQIGKILGIDFGYARRLILGIRKKNGIWCP